MKSAFWKTFFLLFLLELAMVPVSFPALGAGLYDFDSGPGRGAEYSRISRAAYAEGEARVIAELVIPDYERLRNDSNSYGTVIPGRRFPSEGVEADLALKGAIDLVVDSVLEQMDGTSYTVNRVYSSLPFLALTVSSDALAVLEALPEILNIREDRRWDLISPVEGNNQLSKDGSFVPEGQEEPLLNNTVSIIGADDAWNMGYTGSGWYVALLDSGIRRTHEFFSGKTIIEACYALGDDGTGPAGDCPNGFSQMTGTGAAAHHSSTYYGWDHGTHVAGIAVGDNGSLYGVAKDAGIIAVQVFSKFSAADCGGVPCIAAWESDSVAGLDYVYSIRGSYSIASVNMSLGGGSYSAACDSDIHKTAIDNLRAAGIVTCIATGNDGYCGKVGAPSCISTCVAVGASTNADKESYFNNWDETMQDLFAPGSAVYSSTGDSNTSYESWDGTSMAAPHVAGAWALLKEAYPPGSVAQLLTAVENTGAGITSVCDGYSTAIPRIQVDGAIGDLPAPEIKVRLIGMNLTDGSSRDFGTVSAKKIVSKVLPFTIQNTGAAPLLITGSPKVYITGPASNYFYVSQLPASSVAAGGSTTFKIRCIYTSVPPSIPSGWKKSISFTVNIPNNDPDENPYDFTLSCKAEN